MEKDKVDKVKEEPRLSGAYIRSLVKHLTSIKTKESFNGDENLLETINMNVECFGNRNNMQQETPPPPPPPPPHKKQVRRRQHTTRPFPERLLNMAEARREIVTALKFHRASMKQQELANNNHDPHLSLGQERKSKSRACPTTAIATNSYLENYPGLSSVPYSYYYYPPMSSISPPSLPPLYHENLNFTLPNQTLGLNLNFQDFKNLDANLFHNPLSNYSSASSSVSTSSSAATTTTTSFSGVDVVGNNLHHAMDDEEMEEIRSLGELHQMEWNDTVNLVKSAQWFRFLKTMEIGPEDWEVDNGFNPFDQVMEFPPWLINANANANDDHFSDHYLQHPALTCMDIGEIEGMDGEWLA